MAVSAKKRKAMPKSQFAMPGEKKYPIDTKKRARNALSRAAQKNTAGSYSAVEKKVKAKYPDIQTKSSKSKSKGKKK